MKQFLLKTGVLYDDANVIFEINIDCSLYYIYGFQ